ncbi:hypothetical protein Y032_0004g1698 [Ancylostoma ceylanicum]|uniref:Abnormal cell migration protein 18-like fibronectin type I domain-containing protein n=1 Tax=Ancylostoma ceylanicum TaxID=53326 RepID=A0A016VTL5_9BILA|nr:hypothetical protein Y032_0004g1698 [Ancylostoma ceylanicum]
MRFFYIYLCLGGALACQFKGKTYKNDEEWTENEAFKMKCKIEPNGSWRTEVSGCVTPDKTVVPVNGEVDIGDHVWECKMSPGGQITLQQKMNKHASCNGHPFGTEWQDKSFQFKCEENGVTKFVGCITKSGALIEDGEKKSVGELVLDDLSLLNSSLIVSQNHSVKLSTSEVSDLEGADKLLTLFFLLELDGFEMECKKHANGTVTLGVLDRAVDANCKDAEGKERKQGEKWVENQYFEKICKERGKVEIAGCRVEAVDDLIPINGKVSAGNLDYHCEAKDGSYKFYSKVKGQ